MRSPFFFRITIATTIVKKGQRFDQPKIFLIQRVVDDWEDLGLGRILQDNNTENNSNALTHNNQNVRDSTNCVFFRVVRWMSASLFREWLGLKPKDFHITVGFKVSDIHNFPKNESTIIKRANEKCLSQHPKDSSEGSLSLIPSPGQQQ